jgi:hypothetical protein
MRTSDDEKKYTWEVVTESRRGWEADTTPVRKNISELSPEIQAKVGLNGDTPLM